MTYFIYDIIIAVLLLAAVWRGYRKGFVLTLCGFLAIFVAFIGATVLSNALVTPFSHTIRPVVEQNIQQLFQEQLPQAPEGSGQVDAPPSGTADLPLQEALQLLKNSKVYRGFADAVEKAVSDGMVSATANAARVIADYIARQAAQMVLFLVSFVLILVLWFFLSHALDLAFRLPLLSTLNQWSGAVLGLFKGGLLLYIACWLLKGSFLPQAAIQHTYLLKFFCTSSPLSLLF